MDEFDKACFEEDLEELLKSEDAKRWMIEKTGDLEVNAVLGPRSDATALFTARLRWAAYPKGLPSLKFLDGVKGSDTNAKAWPTGQGMRPASLDTCMHWTLEGHGLHPEWARVGAYRLNPEANVLAQAIGFLQQWFDLDYKGRHQG